MQRSTRHLRSAATRCVTVAAFVSVLGVATPAAATPPPPPPPPPGDAPVLQQPVRPPGSTDAPRPSRPEQRRRPEVPASSTPTSTAPGSSTTPGAPGGDTEKAETSLDAVKQSGTEMIAARLEALDRADAALADGNGRTRNLTDAHRVTLTSIVRSTRDGLESTGAQLAAATDVATARELKRSIVETYRVFMLRMPQVRLTSAADTVAAVADKLDDAVARARTALDEAAVNGVDTAAALAELDRATAAAESARDATAGVGDEILSLEPSQMPAAKSTLAGYRTTIREALRQLKDATSSVRSAVRGLAGERPPAAAPTRPVAPVPAD